MSSLQLKKGILSRLNTVPIQDGQLLFTTDTRDIFLDSDNNRLQITNQFMLENEIIDLLVSIDAIPVLVDEDGAIFTTTTDDILLI